MEVRNICQSCELWQGDQKKKGEMGRPSQTPGQRLRLHPNHRRLKRSAATFSLPFACPEYRRGRDVMLLLYLAWLSTGSVEAPGAAAWRFGGMSAFTRPPAHSIPPISMPWNFGLSQTSSR